MAAFRSFCKVSLTLGSNTSTSQAPLKFTGAVVHRERMTLAKTKKELKI